MRFEPNYEFKTEEEFRNLIDDIRTCDNGWNFVQSCRMWYTENGETVMIEHDVSTLTDAKIVEESSDWLTVYSVVDENDYDTSKEIWTDEVDKDITLEELKSEMIKIAKRMFDKTTI